MTDPIGRDGHVTDLALETALVVGDSAISAHLEGCPTCAARWQALKAHDTSFQMQPPTTQRSPSYWGLAAAAVVLVAGGLLYWQSRPTPSAHPTPDILAKGGAAFQLIVNTDDRTHLTLPNETVSPGSRIAFRAKGPAGHLMILGQEGTRTPYLCYPQQSQHSAPFKASETYIDLKGAMRLDDQGTQERFIAIWCPEPLDLPTATHALTDKDWPAGCVVREQTLQKSP